MTTDNSDPRDYILDLSTQPASPPPQMNNEQSTTNNPSRASYLSIHFKCCNVYAHIYKNATGTAYAGHCPRCHRRAQIPIGPGGSTARIFSAE